MTKWHQMQTCWENLAPMDHTIVGLVTGRSAVEHIEKSLFTTMLRSTPSMSFGTNVSTIEHLLEIPSDACWLSFDLLETAGHQFWYIPNSPKCAVGILARTSRATPQMRSLLIVILTLTK